MFSCFLELPLAQSCVVIQESPLGWIAQWDFWLTIFTLGLAAFTAWLAFETRKLRKDAADSSKAAREAILLTHRPRLIVRNVMTQGDPLAGSLDVSGSFQIYNAGNTLARVFNITCESWVGGSLPMKVPYNTRGGDKQEHPLFPVLPGIYQTQQFTISDKFNWHSDTEPNAANYIGLKNGSLDIYIMGDISYSDGLDNQRVTRFCRRWDRNKKRFFAVDDSEYESID
jgi:hypothetical protein